MYTYTLQDTCCMVLKPQSYCAYVGKLHMGIYMELPNTLTGLGGVGVINVMCTAMTCSFNPTRTID